MSKRGELGFCDQVWTMRNIPAGGLCVVVIPKSNVFDCVADVRPFLAANENEEQKQDLVPPLYRGFTPPGFDFLPGSYGGPHNSKNSIT